MEYANSGIVALIPAFNEQTQISEIVHAVRAFLPVVVVDDGSQDATAQRSEAAGALVLRQIPNQGKGAALAAGFHYALQNGFNAVVTLDADGQHDPREIPAFIQAFLSRRADLIIGRRNFREMPWVRRLSNNLGTLLFSWALGQPVADNQSGYRLISARLMAALLNNPSQERGFEYEVEMIVQCVLEGLHLDWVPIRTIYEGTRKSHIRPLHHLVKFLQVTLRTHQRIAASKAK